MAGCLSCGESGNISPENVRRWTDKLSNVLLSSTARQKFHDYLESRELEQGQRLLEFWEKCDKFLTQAETPLPVHHTQGRTRKSPKKKASSPTGQWDHHRISLKAEAQSIVEFAEIHINFDQAQMQTLYNAVRSEDHKKMVKAISEAKQCAAEMLEDEGYHEFCRYLLQKQGLLKAGD